MLGVGFCVFVIFTCIGWCVYDTWKTGRPAKRAKPSGHLSKSNQQVAALHKAASTNNVIRFFK
jgi:hypothetical protein